VWTAHLKVKFGAA